MNPRDAGGIVRLQVGDDELSFFVPADGRTLQAGSLAPARQLLRHAPVTAAELEALIELIEERIMPSLRLLPAATGLEAVAAEMDDVARALAPGADGGQVVGIDEVERLFNRLADVASGSPVAAAGLPADAAFALRLVLLREVMHHGGFAQVTLLS